MYDGLPLTLWIAPRSNVLNKLLSSTSSPTRVAFRSAWLGTLLMLLLLRLRMLTRMPVNVLSSIFMIELWEKSRLSISTSRENVSSERYLDWLKRSLSLKISLFFYVLLTQQGWYGIVWKIDNFQFWRRIKHEVGGLEYVVVWHVHAEEAGQTEGGRGHGVDAVVGEVQVLQPGERYQHWTGTGAIFG